MCVFIFVGKALFGCFVFCLCVYVCAQYVTVSLRFCMLTDVSVGGCSHRNGAQFNMTHALTKIELRSVKYMKTYTFDARHVAKFAFSSLIKQWYNKKRFYPALEKNSLAATTKHSKNLEINFISDEEHIEPTVISFDVFRCPLSCLRSDTFLKFCVDKFVRLQLLSGAKWKRQPRCTCQWKNCFHLFLESRLYVVCVSII